MTSRTSEYAPNYSVSPGDHIAEFLEMRGLSQKELAERAGVTPNHIDAIIKGGARITPEFARSLGMIFDYPAEMWLSFQNTYDISILESKEGLEKDSEYLPEHNNLVKAN